MRTDPFATTQSVVQAGGVPPLVQMLQSDDSLAVTGAAAACCNLADSSSTVKASVAAMTRVLAPHRHTSGAGLPRLEHSQRS